MANLSADLPNTLSPSLHLSFFALNNKIRRAVIDCDLCRIRIKGGSIAPFLSLNLSFPLDFKADGTDGRSAKSQKNTSAVLFDEKTATGMQKSFGFFFFAK